MTVAESAIDILVVGYFDPVLADHVIRLAAIGEKVSVSLLDPPDPLLPARARAELVAALGSVEQVIIGDARAQAKRIIDFTVADLAARQELIDRVRQRSAQPVV